MPRCAPTIALGLLLALAGCAGRQDTQAPRSRALQSAPARQAPPRAPEITVGAEPLDVISAGGRLWTENYGDGGVSIVNPASGSVRSVHLGGAPGGIAFG